MPNKHYKKVVFQYNYYISYPSKVLDANKKTNSNLSYISISALLSHVSEGSCAMKKVEAPKHFHYNSLL
jgi:hypothetical protein